MEILLLLLFLAGLFTNPGRYRVHKYANTSPAVSISRLPLYIAAVVAGFLIFVVITVLSNT